MKVEFIKDEQLNLLLDSIKNIPFKRMLQLTLMSGARPCEIIQTKYEENVYKNDKGVWTVKLPKIKGTSYKKYAIPIDMYEEDLYPFLDNLKLKKGEKVFNISEATFRKLMRHYTTKYIDKPYSPKILRKTARMIRTRAGYSSDWINKLMGHSPDNKVQKHYVNYDGLDNEELANDKLKDQLNPSLKANFDKLKLRTQAQEEENKKLKEEMSGVKEMLKDLWKERKI